ncbi:MAG: hypothetical protein ACM3US_01190 [Sphingomonadaceae bacterium]
MSAEDDARRRREEWEAAGRPDYNNLITDSSGNIIGYHSVDETPPALRSESNAGYPYTETDWTRNTFLDYFRQMAQKSTSSNYSGANMSSTNPNDPFKGIAGAAFFNPFDPDSYTRGWGKTLQAGGINPLANTPFVNYLSSMAAPLASNYLLRAVLEGNATPASLVGGLQEAYRNAGLGGLYAGDALASLKNLVGQYYGGQLSNGMQMALLGNMAESPNYMMQVLGNALGGGLSGAARGIANYLQRLYGQWNLQDTDVPWLQYFFDNFVR